jgi:hypothetical protein
MTKAKGLTAPDSTAAKLKEMCGACRKAPLRTLATPPPERGPCALRTDAWVVLKEESNALIFMRELNISE